jgi:hypothetical protein
LFSLLLFSGCGVYSFTGASISPEARTFSVAYFQNQADIVSAGLSESFTERLKEKMIRETNLAFTQDNGDLHFEGFIVNFITTPVSVGTNTDAAQNRLTISVRVVFNNAKDPQFNFENIFSAYGDFPGNRTLADVEGQLVPEITNDLVQQIFQRAVINW